MQDIPVITVSGATLASAYEQALVALARGGVEMGTQYDRPGDPPSIDATMNITVDRPFSDPMIHKAFPGGIEDLREYVIELLGEKDHWVKNMDDPEDTRWEYTYHQRLADWGTWKRKASGGEGQPGSGVDQIAGVVDKLATQPSTRQAQMITWMPTIDFDVYDPPCLQSIWYRLTEGSDSWYLSANVRFRSNDAWGANFMNMFGFTHFNRLLIADPLEERLGKPVALGRMNWQADSYHVYGKDRAEFTARLLDRIETSSFEDRVFSFFDDAIQEIWNDAETQIRAKIKAYDERQPGR